MRTKVLFADDQLPYDDQASNDAVKAAIFESIKDILEEEGKDPEKAYAEDFAWFSKLLQHMGDRFDVKAVRRFEVAEIEIQKRDDYDVAIIDLSWSGDDKLPLQKRKNRGLELLRKINEDNQSGKLGYKPIIVLSQNFSREAGTMSLVLESGGLPIAKDYSDVGQRALSSAVKYLVNLRPPDSKVVQTTEEVVAKVNRSTAIITALVTALFTFVGTATTAYFTYKSQQSSIPVVEQSPAGSQKNDGE